MALCTALGATSAFSFAPYFFWPAMLLAMCGLIWFLDATPTPKQAAACGWFFGLGQFTSSLYWISESFQYQANMPSWVGSIAVAGLAAYLSLYPALALFIASRFWPKSSLRVLLFAASWSATEWLRGHLMTGFPWNMVAQVWSDTPVALQSARFVGAYGLSLVTVTIFASVALLTDKTAASRRAFGVMAMFALILLGDGWWRLAATQNGLRSPLRVHIVQANVSQDQKSVSGRKTDILALYERMTADVLLQRGPALVIWPETAIQSNVEGNAFLRSRLANVIGIDGHLILGAVGQRRGSDGAWVGSRNSLLLVDGSGAVRAAYDKVRLVPFGEFLPAGRVLSRLGLSSVAGGGDRFLAGRGITTIAVPGIAPFSPLICYEVVFPGEVVERSARPAWLVNISNDAWFGDSWGPHQHLAQARIRAVEEGLPVVRSTPTGVSAVIDGYGRVLVRTGMGEQTVLTANVPQALPPTPYALAGDWLFLALLFVCILIGFGAVRLVARPAVSRSNGAARGA